MSGCFLHFSYIFDIPSVFPLLYLLLYSLSTSLIGYNTVHHINTRSLKLVSSIFIKFLFFDQMIALKKLWKMLFISSKKVFSFSRYSNFLYFCPSLFFLPVSHCFRGWSKINLKVHDVINCLNKSSITHFVWYSEKEKETLSIDRVSDRECFYRKIMQKICSKS